MKESTVKIWLNRITLKINAISCLKNNSKFLFKKGRVCWKWIFHFLNNIFLKIKNLIYWKLKKSDSFVDDENLKFLEIEFFQLNNLIKNRIPFSFYWITDEKKSVKDIENQDLLLEGKNFSSKAVQFLKYAEKINPEQLYLLSPSQPVILICEDGRKSQKIALELSKRWTNVFYIKGGLLGNKTDGSMDSSE